ncbi:ClpP protease-like protein [Paracoccus pantotrophus]|uniref:ATP-dependent Clp protease proteolytic subunit n=1 Tax=Paracoccus pantotrophus TaxID=82367 RepID=A0AAE6TX13_PARPN|nr:head maturation protease, ClpP-related [Paracoccus pantotrophus]QFG38310.1 Clp protease ClpP [Paracoccus pantotrophus]RKS51172.1 ClpP protease-like protein [Paracoccus pantotrophus]
MAKNHMPVAHFGVRPDDVRAECAPPKAFEKWQPELRARAEAVGDDSGPFAIDVMDVIGDTWDGYGVTGRKVGALLRAAGEREVVVNINSPGGDVFEGLAIYNMLRGHKADVTVRIVGLAASAASVIAMAGDRVEIARAGFLMIHNTWVYAIGDRHDLATVAGQLGAFDEVMAELYSLRTKIDAGQIGQMMDRETWISGRAAIDQGFADDLLAADAIEVSEKAKAQAPQTKTIARIEAALSRDGMTRSERRAAIKALTSKPSAADDDMPRAVETMASLTGWAKSLTAKMEN